MYKQITFSLTTALLFSSFAVAGGDITPVEEVPIPVAEDNSAFYVGAGLSHMSLESDYYSEEFSSTGIMLQAGYRFNSYIAMEGRYTLNVGDLKYDHGNSGNPDYSDYPGDFTNVALYLKPMYSFDAFTVYGLLGYGEVTLTDLPHPGQTGSVDRAESGFQWGLGASYKMMDQLSVFVDYVKMYDDKGFDYRAQKSNIDADLWTLGLTYSF